MRLELAERAGPLPLTVAEDPRHRQLRVVVDDRPRQTPEVVKRGVVSLTERFGRLSRERLHERIVAVRQINDQEMRLALNAVDHDESFAEVRFARRPQDARAARTSLARSASAPARTP